MMPTSGPEGRRLLRTMALGALVGVVVDALATTVLFLRPPALLLVIPPLAGALVGWTMYRYALPRWTLVLAALVLVPALPALQFLHLHYLAARIPLPPDAAPAARRVGLGDMMSGPFAQVKTRSPSPFDTLVAFYQATMAAQGWKGRGCISLDEYSSYSFAKPGAKMFIVIGKEPDAPDRRLEVTHYAPVEDVPVISAGVCVPVTRVLVPATPP